MTTDNTTPMVEIEPSTEVTVLDTLNWALHEISRAIALTNGGRDCSGPVWAAMHASKGQIELAVRKIQTGRKVA